MTKQRSENPAHEAKTRKPYLKPSYQREQVFETMALTCGKIQTTQASCHHNRKSS